MRSEQEGTEDHGATGESLFGNRDFRRLFAAQLTSLVGSGVTSIALAAFAYELVGSDATVVVGTALMLRILAFVVISPIAGVTADRVDRKRVLVAADLIRVALMGVFPFITSVSQIYVLIFAINAVTAFFTPTFEAILPQVVGLRQYTKAVSLSRIALALEATLGPILAGLLIATVGVRWTFWVDGGTYLVSALFVLGATVPRARRPTSPFHWRNLVSQVTHGTRILLREPALRKALVLHFAEAVAGAIAIVTTIVYVRDILERGNVAFAVVMAAVGAGSAVVALLLPWRSERARVGASGRLEEHLQYHRWAERSMVVGGAVLAFALLPGLLVPGVFVLAVLWGLNGAGQALIAIPSVGLLAEHTAPDERGRAYAAHFALTHLFWLGTYPLSGYLARGAGTPMTFTVGGVACALLTLAALMIRGPHRRHRLERVG